MNIFSRILFGSRTARKSLSHPPADRLYIVDATGLVNPRYRTGNGQASPRDHALILRDLIQFASSENIQMAAVFTGRPLREASEGSTQRGITVHYTDTCDNQKKRIQSLVRHNRRKKDIVVLTSDKQVELEARALGAACMRLSTLKKVLEGGSERNRQPRKPAPERPPANRTGPENNARSAGVSNSGVLSLIDPV